jgi:hypothetical protein
MTTSSPPRSRGTEPRLGLGALAALTLALGALVIAITTDGAALRIVGGIGFVVAVGASLTSVLRIGSDDVVERVALALGLGLSATIAGGLLLDLVGSLNAVGWFGFGAIVLGLGLLTAAQSLAVAARSPRPVTAPDASRDRRARATNPALVVVTAAVCLAAVVVALVIAVDSAHEQTGDGFTTLALDVPSEREAELGVVVENRERVASHYRLVASTADAPLLELDLQLAADERRSVAVPIAALPSGTRVVVVLHRDGGVEPYRTVSMTIP